MINKLRQCFGEMVVYKDLKKSNFFSSISLPSFMRDWLLKRFGDENGNFDHEELSRFIHTYLPNKKDWTEIKNRIIIENERVKFLAKVSADVDIKTGEVYFSLPDFGLAFKDTIVDPTVWDLCKDDLVASQETWGMVELYYRPPVSVFGGKKSGDGSDKGKIALRSFKSFRPYVIDLEYYQNTRKEFSIDEWIDLLLGAVDYNADGYLGDQEKKLAMLTRLLPFVEKRLNLIELAPKGTGKSYLFGRVSRYGWLVSGGSMTRAKLFYDIAKRKEGLISGNDFVTLDEVQTISFGNVNEIQGALKGYLEEGKFKVGSYEGTADAGMILCGNISQAIMDADGYSNMFSELPEVFHESALIDRFHGFIKGWKLPRMHEDLKASGWALNSEYFCSILHELRSDMQYRMVVDALIKIPEAADTRNTEAVKRIATAYLKLLFPHVREPGDISKQDFKRYCLDPAFQMRKTIFYQLGILDEEYKRKTMDVYEVCGEVREKEE